MEIILVGIAFSFLLIFILIAVPIFFLVLFFSFSIFHIYLPSFVRESTAFNNAFALASDVAWMLHFLIRHCLIPNLHYRQQFHGVISNILRMTLEDMEWKHASGRDSVDECSVCLYNVVKGEEIGDLTCGHVFHRFCLETWVKYGNLTCPVCRGLLTTAGLDTDGGCDE